MIIAVSSTLFSLTKNLLGVDIPNWNEAMKVVLNSHRRYYNLLIIIAT